MTAYEAKTHLPRLLRAVERGERTERYLELALRLALPLATLDRALGNAAAATGVELLTA